MIRAQHLLSYWLWIVMAPACMLTGCAAQHAQLAEADGRASLQAPARPSGAPAAKIDPQAGEIFRKMSTALDAARAMHFRVRAVLDRPVDSGQLAQFHRTSDVVAVRPDKLYVTTKSDEGSWRVWQRGKNLVVLDKDDNIYATETVPASIGEMLDDLVNKYDLVMPMADLLAGNTYDAMTRNVESAEYLGVRSVADTKCDHLLFRQENIDWQIWIQAEGQPLPRKLVITYTQQPDQPQYAALIDEWNLAPAVSEDVFTFAAPAGAKAIGMLDLISESQEQ